MIVRAKQNFLDFVEDECLHPTLGPGHEYFVISLSSEDYRIISEAGDPILFPRALFDVLSEYVPSDWVREDYEDVFRSGPPAIEKPGFFEDFHGSDGDHEATARCERILVEVLRGELAQLDSRERAVLERDLERLLAMHPPAGTSACWRASSNAIDRIEIQSRGAVFALVTYGSGEPHGEPCSSHLTLQEAKQRAARLYAVGRDMWRRVDDLHRP
ncbi:MAG: hypothetical protein HOV81_43940 [Kofleriaceae bacterium]|nr:hypothetical protein [Kofleriaceae bacterium]